MRFPRIIRNSRRHGGAKFTPDVGYRTVQYNYGYPPFCYHMNWKGSTDLAERIDERQGKKIRGESQSKILRKAIGDACELFAKYDTESYKKSVEILTSQQVNKSESTIKWEDVPAGYPSRSKYKTPVFCPKFGSLSIRSLLYLMQGIEANGGLAVKKRFDYRERQGPFDQVEYKTPGKTLVSAGQWEDIKHKLQSQCITDGEMPPVYIPRSPFDNYEYNYQDGGEEYNKLFKMTDGSSLVMTDVSAGQKHSERTVLVREGVTGILREAHPNERTRRIQMYYPGNFSSLDMPVYVNPNNPENVVAMENMISNFGWKGAIQIMDTAIAYYIDLQDERYFKLRYRLNNHLIENERFDDFYASRHMGQFILHMVEYKQISPLKFIEHIAADPNGHRPEKHVKRNEIRAFIKLLEIWTTVDELTEIDDQELSGHVLYTALYPETNWYSPMIHQIWPERVPDEMIDLLELDVDKCRRPPYSTSIYESRQNMAEGDKTQD